MVQKHKAAKSKMQSKAKEQGDIPPTVSHLLGEMTWLLSQSPLHRSFTIGDLEWLIMPALIHEQFYLSRDEERPVALTTWAKCNDAAIAKLERGMIEPENRLSLEEWNSGETVWIVDMITPFADDVNKHRELLIADLVSGPLSKQEFNFHQTDIMTGERKTQTVAADAGEKLRASLMEAVAQK